MRALFPDDITPREIEKINAALGMSCIRMADSNCCTFEREDKTVLNFPARSNQSRFPEATPPSGSAA